MAFKCQTLQREKQFLEVRIKCFRTLTGNGLKYAIFSADLFINMLFIAHRIKINVSHSGS